MQIKNREEKFVKILYYGLYEKKHIIFKNLNIQFALGLSAASALIYEVVATKMLYFYFTESSYSIATVLSVFLFGLGIGSLVIYYLSNRIKDKRLLFGVLQLLIALFVISNKKQTK